MEKGESSMDLLRYDGKLVRVTTDWGDVFSGVADYRSAEYSLSEYGREEDLLDIEDSLIYESEIAAIELLPTYEEACAAIKPGRYRHFKGGLYEVLGVARHSEDETAQVVYRALYGEGGLWVRPAYMWLETVQRDGKCCPRFEKIDD